MGSARIAYVLFETAVGKVGLAWKGSEVLAIQLPDATAEGTVERLVAQTGAAAPGRPPPRIARAVERIRRSLAGEAVDLSRIALGMDALTPFQREVFTAARRVKRGQVLSYGELAAIIGRPGAARAVGGAMASCPFPVVVPCQRIVGANGAPGGWSSWRGLDAKAELLALEGRALRVRDRALLEKVAERSSKAVAKTKATAGKRTAAGKTKPARKAKPVLETESALAKKPARRTRAQRA